MPSKVLFWVCSGHNHSSSPIVDLHCFKWKIVLKIVNFVLLTSILFKFRSFRSYQSRYDLSTPSKVHFGYCFVCTIIFSVHLLSYNVPNRKLDYIFFFNFSLTQRPKMSNISQNIRGVKHSKNHVRDFMIT